jgi:hypothetical protein
MPRLVQRKNGSGDIIHVLELDKDEKVTIEPTDRHHGSWVVKQSNRYGIEIHCLGASTVPLLE